MRLSVLVLFVYFVVPAAGSFGFNTTVDDVKRLRARANSSNYDKWIRPLKNQSNVLEVTLGLTLYSVIDFDQTKQALSTSVQLRVYWQDELLAWEKEDYGGIEGLLFAQDDIWKPDLYLNNSYHSFTGFGSDDLAVWVTSDGNVSWYPIQVLESQCSIYTYNFPYDNQTCSLFFESANYPESQLKLLSEGEDGLQLAYKRNNEWAITSTYTVEHEPGAVEFKLELQRRWGYYQYNLVAPIILVSLLCPFVFLVPVESGERSGFASLLFLTFCVFQSNIGVIIPKNANGASFTSRFLFGMMAFTGLIVFISLVEIRLHREKEWVRNSSFLKTADVSMGITIFVAIIVWIICLQTI
ncbi:acetylcholine receptor subunit beta-like [Dreissena polymorpha]|uniref:acetylcholine receptor subunit beta-like n=1 Tax=Dreissena polymorpha TaxID=45954 RepID=UPI00226529A4|nr:acetylcholine receptor subunit beta-like [Dreissena polymorpha]